MTPGLSHDAAFAALGAVALDALDVLDDTAPGAVSAHVADCDLCRVELESLRAAAANLAFAAPTVPDRGSGSRLRVRDQLISRAAANGQARRLANPPLLFPTAVANPTDALMNEEGGRRIPEWFALVASALFVVSLGVLAVVFRDRDTVRGTLAEQTVKTERVGRTGDSLQAVIASRDSVIAGLTARDVAMITLTSRTGKDSYARIFWDRGHNTWTLFARNMSALRPGRTYQVWLVTAKATVSAGTFNVQNGAGVLRAAYAVAPENLRAVAVTEEPAGGVAVPSGETILAGK